MQAISKHVGEGEKKKEKILTLYESILQNILSGRTFNYKIS